MGLPPAAMVVAALRGNRERGSGNRTSSWSHCSPFPVPGSRFTRPYPLDVHVLLVHANDGQPEGDLLVMPDRHTWTRGLAGADDVPAGSHEVRDVANRGMRDRAV